MYLSQVTTCPGIDIALEEGFDQAGKVGFGVLHASQLVGHAARLLYLTQATRPIKQYTRTVDLAFLHCCNCDRAFSGRFLLRVDCKFSNFCQGNITAPHVGYHVSMGANHGGGTRVTSPQNLEWGR